MDLISVLQGATIAFGSVFLMELGDKTQLMSFMLASRYRAPFKVFIGVITGLTSVTLIGVVIGLLLKETLDLSIISPLIGLAFVLIGLYIIVKVLKSDPDEEFICPVPELECPHKDEECPGPDTCPTYIKEYRSKGAFKNSFILSFAAELGDKTMLMTVGLTTQLDFGGVLFGAVLALAVVNFTGVFLGDRIARILPRRTMELIGAGLFIVTGILITLF